MRLFGLQRINTDTIRDAQEHHKVTVFLTGKCQGCIKRIGVVRKIRGGQGLWFRTPTNPRFRVHGFKERKSLVRGSLTGIFSLGAWVATEGARASGPRVLTALAAHTAEGISGAAPAPPAGRRPALHFGPCPRKRGSRIVWCGGKAEPSNSDCGLRNGGEIQSGVAIRPVLPRRLPPHQIFPRRPV